MYMLCSSTDYIYIYSSEIPSSPVLRWTDPSFKCNLIECPVLYWPRLAKQSDAFYSPRKESLIMRWGRRSDVTADKKKQLDRTTLWLRHWSHYLTCICTLSLYQKPTAWPRYIHIWRCSRLCVCLFLSNHLHSCLIVQSIDERRQPQSLA